MLDYSKTTPDFQRGYEAGFDAGHVAAFRAMRRTHLYWLGSGAFLATITWFAVGYFG